MGDGFDNLVSDARLFLSELAENNDRDWFLANKDRYDSTLKRPAELLLDQLSADLGKSLEVPVKPKLFRPHRDVRFSKDKTPYHLHLHMLWSADLGGIQPVNFFYGISPTYISAGAGFMGFEKNTLTSWRSMIDGPLGADMDALLSDLTSDGFRIGDPELKRIPAPYDNGHPRGNLLKRKSLSVWRDYEAAEMAAPTETLANVFKDLNPMVQVLGGLR